MISITSIRIKLMHQIIMPIVCIVGATQLSLFIINLTGIDPGSNIGLTACIVLTLLIYVALLLITGTLGSDEFEFLNASLLSERQYEKKLHNKAISVSQAVKTKQIIH